MAEQEGGRVTNAAYGPDSWVLDPWLSTLAVIAVVAAFFAIWVAVMNWADWRKAREERRMWARTAYEDAVLRMRQGMMDRACANDQWTTVIQAVEAWRHFRHEDPKHCPTEPEIPLAILATIEPVNRLRT